MNQRDLELLSSYLDGQLSPSDVSGLEARLKADPQLVSVLNDLRATRSLLRKLPKRRAPRNFTLTRKMVGLNPPLPKAYPVFRFASVFATLLLVFSFGVNSFARLSAVPVGFGMGGGGGADVTEQENVELFSAAPAAEAATEAPAEPSMAQVAPTQISVTEAAVANAARVVETPSEKAGDAASSGVADQAPVAVEAQSPAMPVSSAWQIGLAGVIILSVLLMFILRQMAASRWR